ncbi:MAG: PAS domain S-box protein, partial [Deltaproteobacteria bacterium]|nr:PAS domain S-box protein [Deltaproteobacteria bacterium]
MVKTKTLRTGIAPGGVRKATSAKLGSLSGYQAIFENTGTAMVIIEEDTTLSLVNAEFERLSGFTKEEIEGKKSWMEFLAKDDLERIKEYHRLRRIDPMLAPRRYEFRFINREGRVRDILLTIGMIPGTKMSVASLLDITERKRTQEALQQGFEKLQSTIKDTIQAMASIVEMRNPFMAGHQERVANLAFAIAIEMGLSQEQTTGTLLAALVHDIGEISIPVEILIKPSKMSEAELTLIKTHPQVGYDILKTIEFPWPIAEIVLQHHERMDGSGYPLGLLGEEILLEARVIGVADVVEAMSSERPHRVAP